MIPDPLRVDFHLLDRQVVDPDGFLIGKVDDVELSIGEDGVPVVTAIHIGQHALGNRIGGVIGRWLAATARRLHETGDPRPLRVPFELVHKVDSAVVLSTRHELMDPSALEIWLRDKVIGRIPGARDAGE